MTALSGLEISHDVVLRELKKQTQDAQSFLEFEKMLQTEIQQSMHDLEEEMKDHNDPALRAKFHELYNQL